MLGIVKGDIRFDYLHEMIKDSVCSKDLADFLWIDRLLLPFSGVDSYLNIKQSNLNLLDILKENAVETIYTGTANDALKELCLKRHIRLVELLKLPEFTIPNARLTAYGIIDYLNRGDRAVCDQRIFLLGYGHISNSLAQLLTCYRCDFAIYTPHDIEQKFVLLDGYRLEEIEHAGKYDITINTIPKNLEVDYLLWKDKTILDVASFPYGFDLDRIQDEGIRYEIYGAIPSKFAPASAAKIIKRILEKY